MTYEEVITYYEGNIRLASYKLEFTQQAIKKWQTNARIPYRTQQLIEALSGGELKADKKLRA